MKRRLGIIFVLAAMLITLTTSFAFAGTLTLQDTYPRDGTKGVQVDNAGVKLYFNQDMVNKENPTINDKCFKFTDSKGKALPIRVLYSPKEKGLVFVLVDNQTLKSDSEYHLKISGKVQSPGGEMLGEDVMLTFNTVDTSSAAKINMAMMGIMMVGVIFFSRQTARKQAERAAEAEKAEEKVNPYKVAKKEGISVEEAVVKDQKAKEKYRVKREKREAKLAKRHEEAVEEVIQNDNKKVKGAKSAAAVGSKYVEKLRAERAEEAKRKAQAGTTKPRGKNKKRK